MLQVTFFVPCLNEEENIYKTLDGVVAAAAAVGVSYEILVVDDASSDDTLGAIASFQEAHPKAPIIVKKNDRTMGLGRNYVDGAFLGNGEYYMMVCGDNTRSEGSVVTILSSMGKADMVLPYFGDRDHRTWFRRFVSRSFVVLVNLISHNSIRYYNGLVLHKRSNVMRWHSDSHGFGSHAELITRLLDEGATYTEVQITNEEREAGKSKAFAIGGFFSVAHSLLEIVLRRLRRVLFKR